jgi:hypothetical protein
MLDSGAFTAFTKGKTVLIDDLIRTYDSVLAKIRKGIKVWLINLDVILPPNAPQAQIDKAIADSDKHFAILKKRYGDRVLPVFHKTDPGYRLREILAMSDYVGFGFDQQSAEKFRIAHAEEALAVATKMKKRVHGLATTGYAMLSRTNFDSVDSASWLYAAAMGKVLVVDQKEEISVIPISAQSPLQRDYRGHFVSLPEEEKSYILKRVADAGITLEQLQNDLSYRILFTARELSEWLSQRKKVSLASEGSLFGL